MTIKRWLACAGIVLVASAALTACSESPEQKAADSKAAAAQQAADNADAVKSVCQGSVKKQLKDPDSAQFSDEQVNDHPTATPPASLGFKPGDHYYIVIGKVNAKNSFGGYIGDEVYGCDALILADGSTTAIASIVDPNATPTETTDDTPSGG